MNPSVRLGGETDRAWAAYVLYRDAGPQHRSLARVATALVGQADGDTPAQPRSFNTVRRQVEEWSSKHHWRERVETWDRELDLVRRTSQKEAVAEMAERHAALAQSALDAAIRPAIEVLRRSANGSLGLAEIDDATLLKLNSATSRVIGSLAEVEVRARGMLNTVAAAPTETPVAPTVAMTDADVIALWVALEELGVHPSPPPDRPA